MATRIYETSLPFPAAAVRAYHTRVGALQRLMPPSETATVVSQSGTVNEGDRVVIQMMPGITWEAVHHPLADGFVDEMVHGPLSRWTHRHRFLDNGPEACVIRDEIEFAPGIASWVADGRLGTLFGFRSRRLREDMSRLVDRPPLRVLLAGASGLLGTQLAALLSVGGHEVVRLVRRKPAEGEVQWNPAAGTIDSTAIEGFDAVISLSGENVGEGAWTEARKAELIESRLATTGLLARTFAELTRPPRVWLSASAVGIYGDRGDEPLTEASPAGSGFLAELCERWEAAAATVPGVRVVKLRLGVVLTARGGALGQLATAYRFGAGGPVGSGQQFFPWIAGDDALYAMLHCLFDERMSGPVNLVAPRAVRQREFAATLGRTLARPAIVPLPAFAVSALFGEMGREVLLGGQNAVPERLDGRFTWAFPDLADALSFELGTGAKAAPVERG